MPEGTNRLQLLGEIARGGMGAVFKGRDPDFGRDLAVKVLLEKHRDSPDLVRRFVEEAQIGGQLQHPGVVPVHELGQCADGRPFFSMKLVKGRTLAEVLKERADLRSDLSAHVASWLQVCQTVAYAHARGVIHRDLKPSNVMLGSFGEIQVMDWGLAKVLPRGGVVDDATAGKVGVGDTVIATARSGGSDSDLSRAGSVLGTPAYMAPEQARGESDHLDERCDVFALGSILCEILTGQPAFRGRTSAEVQRQAARGELADALARLDACGADAELVALARDSLAPEADDRPRDAGAVAARGTAYLAGVQEKLRRAELERVEERGRRRLTTVAAAAVLLVGFVGGGGYAWVQRQRAERVARTARAVDNALTDVARRRGEAQADPPGAMTKWAEARSAAKRAEGLLAEGEADAPLRRRVASLLAGLDREQADAAEKAHRLDVDHTLLTDLEAVRGARAEHLDAKRTDAGYAAAFRKAGLDLDVREPAEAGRWLASRSEPVELAGYLDDWATVRQKAGRADADGRRLVAAARGADPDPWRDALRMKFGSKDAGAVAAFRRLADDAALEAQPAASLALLARQLKSGGGDGERAARVLRRAASRHPGDFWIHFELARAPGAAAGDLHVMYPNPEEAVRHLTAAVAIRPRSISAHDNLGLALRALGKPDEAAAEYREAIRLNPDDAKAHNYLGNVLYHQGKRDEAVAQYRAAIRLRPDEARAHSDLGNALNALGKRDEAVAECRAAIRLKPDDAWAHANLGNALKDQGKYDEAVAEYHVAIRLMHNKVTIHYNLGNALNAQGKRDEAVTEYRAAIRLDGNHVGEAPFVLGDLLHQMGRNDEALAVFRRILELAPGDPTPDKPVHQTLARAHSKIGLTLAAQGKRDEAVAEYRAAIRLNPDNAEAQCNLGHLLLRRGDYAGALDLLRKGHELGSKQPGWGLPSAQWVAEAEQMTALADRLPALLKGDDHPRDAAERLTLARICHDTKRYAFAARLRAEALEADPKLGDDLRTGFRYAAARAAALAGCMTGQEEPSPDDARKAQLRRQALDWLKLDLALRSQQLDTDPAEARQDVARAMASWTKDSDLLGVRDPEALAKLPEAEREEWRALWADVEALRKRAEGRTP
jgi:serine/threonine-protein kinase